MKTTESRIVRTLDMVRSGLLGGFVSTAIVSVIMLIKNATGAIPGLHIPQTLSVVLGVPNNVLVGGVAFLIIGILFFGALYPIIAQRIPFRSHSAKGLVFGLAIWLAMMLLIMPLTGAGFFAVNRDAIVPAADLVLALLYGLILALIYAWDMAGAERPLKRDGGSPDVDRRLSS